MPIIEGIGFPFTRFYDAVVARRVLQEEYERITSSIDLPGGTILDLGTGPGRLAIETALRNPKANVIGIDISAAMVSLARKKARGVPNVVFRVMSVERLFFPDNTVDLVVSTASLHHWRNPDLALEEIYRVLRTGGRVFLYDLRSDASRREVFRDLGRTSSFPPKLAILWGVRQHGFTRDALDSKILPIIKASSFREGRLEPVRIWYRISLFKP